MLIQIVFLKTVLISLHGYYFMKSKRFNIDLKASNDEIGNSKTTY